MMEKQNSVVVMSSLLASKLPEHVSRIRENRLRSATLLWSAGFVPELLNRQ